MIIIEPKKDDREEELRNENFRIKLKELENGGGGGGDNLMDTLKIDMAEKMERYSVMNSSMEEIIEESEVKSQVDSSFGKSNLSISVHESRKGRDEERKEEYSMVRSAFKINQSEQMSKTIIEETEQSETSHSEEASRSVRKLSRNEFDGKNMVDVGVKEKGLIRHKLRDSFKKAFSPSDSHSHSHSGSQSESNSQNDSNDSEDEDDPDFDISDRSNILDDSDLSAISCELYYVQAYKLEEVWSKKLQILATLCLATIAILHSNYLFTKQNQLSILFTILLLLPDIYILISLFFGILTLLIQRLLKPFSIMLEGVIAVALFSAVLTFVVAHEISLLYLYALLINVAAYLMMILTFNKYCIKRKKLAAVYNDINSPPESPKISQFKEK